MLYFNRTKAIKRHNFNSSLYLLQTSFSIYVIYLSKIMGFFGHYKCYTCMKQLNSSEKKKKFNSKELFVILDIAVLGLRLSNI